MKDSISGSRFTFIPVSNLSRASEIVRSTGSRVSRVRDKTEIVDHLRFEYFKRINNSTGSSFSYRSLVHLKLGNSLETTAGSRGEVKSADLLDRKLKPRQKARGNEMGIQNVSIVRRGQESPSSTEISDLFKFLRAIAETG